MKDKPVMDLADAIYHTGTAGIDALRTAPSYGIFCVSCCASQWSSNAEEGHAKFWGQHTKPAGQVLCGTCLEAQNQPTWFSESWERTCLSPAHCKTAVETKGATAHDTLHWCALRAPKRARGATAHELHEREVQQHMT